MCMHGRETISVRRIEIHTRRNERVIHSLASLACQIVTCMGIWEKVGSLCARGWRCKRCALHSCWGMKGGAHEDGGVRRMLLHQRHACNRNHATPEKPLLNYLCEMICDKKRDHFMSTYCLFSVVHVCVCRLCFHFVSILCPPYVQFLSTFCPFCVLFLSTFCPFCVQFLSTLYPLCVLSCRYPA